MFYIIKYQQYQRIEKEVQIIYDHEPSEKYPNQGQRFTFKDSNNMEYDYDTMADVEVYTNEKWLVRMTIIGEDECLDDPYKIVQRVKFIKKL